MQLTEHLAEIAGELSRRNLDVTKGREPSDIEVTPWAIIIRLRPVPDVLIDPEPQPFPVTPGLPVSYMAGSRWHAVPTSDPWRRKP